MHIQPTGSVSLENPDYYRQKPEDNVISSSKGKKNCKPRILYPAKKSFKNLDVKFKNFQTKKRKQNSSLAKLQ